MVAGRRAGWQVAAAVVAVHWVDWQVAAAVKVLQRAPAAGAHAPVQEQIPVVAWVQEGKKAAGERAPVVRVTVTVAPAGRLHLRVKLCLCASRSPFVASSHRRCCRQRAGCK